VLPGVSLIETTARWLAILTVSALPAPVSSEPVRASPPAMSWRRGELAERAAGVAAVARATGSGELAVGDERGLLIGRPGEPFRRVPLRGAVADLAYGAGVLLAATARGLYRVDAEGRVWEVAPGPGAAAREIHRIAAIPGVAALATGDGVFVSRDTQVWRKLAGALPAGPATAVALQRRDDRVRCWASVGGELWRIDLQAVADGFEARESERVVIPFSDRGDNGVLDVLADVGSVELVVVFSQSLAVWRGETFSGAVERGWRTLRPELPPGASMRRLARGAGRWWLATDRGLLDAPDLAGPWRRSAPPAGRFAATDVIAADDFVAVAGDDGLLLGHPRPASAEVTLAPLASAQEPVVSPDPAIELVHRAAVRHLGLEPSRMESLRRGALRRGWLPLLTVRGGAAWDHSRNVDHDEAFVSGETRRLIDRDFDRGDDYDVSLLITWDLGDVAYQPESIDVSRETREVIELRDDVLDEITQLYFERRAVLAALRAPVAMPYAESLRLRMRADELAAGIDAWTGGWFAAQVTPLAP
jgi:hypothetical protein